MNGLPFPLSVPVLTDGVVTLRAATPADVEPMWEMTQDPAMQRWTAVPIPNTREMSEQFALHVGARAWDEGTARMWVVEAEDDDGRPRFAGNVDVRGGPVADIGFTLHPWARGRGIMTAAVRLAVDHGFTEAGIEAVHWRAHVGNEASLRVAHACGFELVGTAPALLHERGRTLDAWTAVLRFGDAPYARRPWQDAPRLRTDRLQLRPLVETDAHRVAQACSDPTTRHWLRTLPHPYTPEVARAFVADCTWRSATGEKITWAVADPVSDDLVALVTLMHLGGVIETASKHALRNRDDLSMVYTPGVARICQAIAADREDARRLTIKRNSVAVVTDGSAVLGLGNIGPHAALPVMEGKAALFKTFGGIDAWPLCLDTQDVDQIVEIVAAVAPGFAGVNTMCATGR